MSNLALNSNKMIMINQYSQQKKEKIITISC